MGVYDIHNNQITGAAFLGTVDLNCQFAGVCNFSSLGDSDIPLAIIPCDLTTTSRPGIDCPRFIRSGSTLWPLISYGPRRAAEHPAVLVPWLMLNILLHPGTGDAYADHIDHAVWLGSVLPLRTDVLRKSRKTQSHS